MSGYEIAVLNQMTEIKVLLETILFVLAVMLVYYLIHNMMKRR